MRNLSKRMLLGLLCFLVVLGVGILPVSASTTDTSEVIYSGKYNNLSWSITANGTLTIEGKGNSDGYEWLNYTDYIVYADVKVEGITRVSYMFSGCENLVSVDLSGSDMSKVTEMERMFEDCISLTDVDLSGLDTSKVETMAYMFYGCENLISVNLGSLDTSNVNSMEGMFWGCESLKSIDLSTLDTSNVESMRCMFCDCSNLNYLNFGTIDTSHVLDMTHMFYGCANLTSLDLSGFDTSSVEDMSYMFCGCEELSSLDVSGFNTSSVTDMSHMFASCYSLESLTLDMFNTSKVTDMSYLFSECNRLKNVDVSGFDTSSVTDMTFMFGDCYELESVDVSGFITSNVTSMYCMFSTCYELSSIDVSGFDTSQVSNFAFMFGLCGNITEIDVSGFDTSNATNMVAMFNSCINLTSINISSFDMTNIEDATGMFSYCENLSQIIVPSNISCSIDLPQVDGYYWQNEDGKVCSYIEPELSAEMTYLRYEGTADISSATINISPSSYTYNGTKKMPTVTVTYNGYVLSEWTDYYLTYSDNVNAGTATVIVEGMGGYSGTVEKTFTINKASQTVSLKTSGSTSIKVGDTTTWTAKTSGNGTITYSTTASSSVATINSSTGKVTAKGVGTVKIYATAASTSNYNASSKTLIATITIGLKTPTISSVTQSGSSVTVKWGKITGASGYYVYRSTSKSSGYSKIATITSGSTVSYEDTASKTNGKTYYYKVYAYSGTTKSDESSAKSISYMKGTVSSLTNVSSGITVKWSKVSGATGYYIYRKAGSGSYSKVKTVTSGSTVSWTDTAVKSKNGTTYTYYVQPYNSSSKGAYATKKTVRLTAVSISSLKNSSSKKMTVKWAKNSKATGYQIQYSTNSSFASGNKTVTVSSASTVSKVISSLTKGKTYYVRIRVYKTVSGTKYYSAWSSKKSVKISK